MAKFCPKCGHGIDKIGDFCEFCGAKLPQVAAPQQKAGFVPLEVPTVKIAGATTPPNRVAAPAPASQPKSDNGGLKIAIGVLLAVIVDMGGFYLWQEKERAEETARQATMEQAKLQEQQSKGQTTSKQKLQITPELRRCIEYKDTADKKIADIATALNTNMSIIHDTNFRMSANEVSVGISETIYDVKNDSSDQAVRAKLLEVLEAEMGRIEGLRDGMRAADNGGDYMPGFKRGTAAAYRFDDLNAELNKMLAN